ncbi:hypothetical protein MYU51_008397 [Penicillium brevicompactum]|uniref:Zinc finger MIZ-type n=1 Tax=Penicillium brevicompactum TaxID=5074 RepID=UPI00253FAE29|nr:Zinc finger MIZ-type [Penicillium brevicompactum]KAJ5327113.1 Zinc finger MIZ-type [Penicillium brevicompactum]
MSRLHDIGESNSTANLFLGGFRRNWMENNRPGPSASNLPSVSAKDSVLMTPITPSETPQLSRGLAVAPDAPPANIPSPANTIPSPAPSTCLPSPVNADCLPSDPRPVEGNHETMAVRPSHGAQGAQQAQQAVWNSRAGGARTQSVAQATHAQAGQAAQAAQITQATTEVRSAPRMQIGRLPVTPPISENTWAQWSVMLDQVVADFQSNGVMQSAENGEANVVKPRIDLMRSAIEQRDTFYVVLHQIYCLHTLDPTSVKGHGIEVLSYLLEDNNKMHFSATFRFANFPDSQARLAIHPWYTDILKNISGFLECLTEKWFRFWKSANHPPLVTDLNYHFTLSSPTMMSVMFLCIARHLHEEKFVERLQILFSRDWTEKNQCWVNQSPSETVQALDQSLIREYFKFPRLSPSSSQAASPNRPAETHQIPAASNSTVTLVSGATRTSSSASPAPVEHPVPSPQTQIPVHPGSVSGPHHQFGTNHPAQNGEASNMRQVPQRAPGPPVVYNYPQGQRANVQNFRTQSPQSPLVQSPQMQGPHIVYNTAQVPMSMSMYIQALHHGQIHPSQALQMGYGQGPHFGTFSSPQYAPNPTHHTNSPAHSPAAYPFTFTSNQHPPHLRTQSPLSASTPTTPVPPPGQTVSQLPRRPSNQRASVSHHPTTLPPRPPNLAYAAPASHQVHPPHQPHQLHSSHPPSPAPNFLNTPMFPSPGYRAPITVNGDPRRLGLHLANLRDPMKKMVKLGPDGQLIDTELFAYFGAFLVLPQHIDVDEPSYTWKFNLSNHDLGKFPQIAAAEAMRSAVWTFKPRCRTVRLRCISHPGNPDSFDSAMWPTSATTWPSVFYITVNGKELHVRRKVQHMKDLPLDITQHLKEGENSIRIDLLLASDECKKSKYFFGVEVMEVSSFEDVVTLVQAIPAAESRAAIQKRLAPRDDDDDLAVVTDNLTIGLVDPFMARIFNVPARSKNCDHTECFDRDTFIDTRKSVPGPSPMIEEWRCPICKADARPQLLVVDGFLAEVHEELTRTNRLNGAQAIQIKADGTWTVKLKSDQTSTETQNRSSASKASLKRKASDTAIPEHPATRTKQEPRNQQSPPASSRSNEVIELD